MSDGSSGRKTRQPRTEGPTIIGWKEWAGLPDWKIRRLKVKIDTGARTSALDVASYELLEVPGVGLVAKIHLKLDAQERVVHTPVIRLVRVRNTSCVAEVRPLVETRVKLGRHIKRIRLTLTNRTGMLHRMILGREALIGDFVVDVSQKYLLRGKK